MGGGSYVTVVRPDAMPWIRGRYFPRAPKTTGKSSQRLALVTELDSVVAKFGNIQPQHDASVAWSEQRKVLLLRRGPTDTEEKIRPRSFVMFESSE